MIAIKKRTLLMWLIFILIGLECEFNFMLPMGLLSDYQLAKLFKCILCILIYAIYNLLCDRVHISRELRWIQGLFLIIIPLNFFVSLILGMTILDAILGVLHYSFIFLIEPVLYVMEDKKSRKKLFSVLLTCACITLLLRAYMSFYYHYHNHEELFPLLSSAAGSKIRYSTFWGYNMLRVYPSCFGTFAVLGFTYIALSTSAHWKKIAATLIAMLAFLYFALLYQTRSYVVIFAVEMFIMFLAQRYENRRGLKQLMKYIISVVVLLIILNSSYVQGLLYSFDVNSELGESTSIRLTGIYLVLDKLIGTIPFGIGCQNSFISNNGLIYLDDYGFLDFLVKNNICGILIYAILIVYFLTRLYRRKSDKHFLLMLTCTFLFFTSMLVVDNFLPRKIGSVPFIIAVFEWAYQRQWSSNQAIGVARN